MTCRRAPSAPRRRRGFTLIETIAAIVILSVALPPMLYVIRSAHSQRVGPVMTSRARWLAAERLEDVIADRHSGTRGYAWLVNSNYPAEAQVSGFENFARSVSIFESEADLVTPGTGYKTVEVTVSWTDVTGTARSLGIVTVLTDYVAP